jgi:starch synthase
MHIVHVAAENGAFPGGKVGGIGDVIRSLPPALLQRGARVSVVTPSHGFLHLQEAAEKIHTVTFRFRGYPHSADVFQIAFDPARPGLKQLIVHHPALESFDPSIGRHRIYTHDSPERPFFTDATRYAFFGSAVSAAAAGGLFGDIDCVHLHDWHAAFVALLRAFAPEFSRLLRLRLVFSIHNLALQGIRPLRGDDSSLEAWFPGLEYDPAAVADPRWPECLNPMASGIRLSDRVHTVSPSYAREIRQPGRAPHFHGGEGLEEDLIRAYREGRLFGILNGCDYPAELPAEKPSLPEVLDIIRKTTLSWGASREAVPASHFLAYARSLELARGHRRRSLTLTAVSRVVDQKVLLLRESGSNGRPGIEGLLDALAPEDCFILLGSGDPKYERFFVETSARRENFLFVNGYSDAVAEALYAGGDLFIMPSSFEPCGLGQLLAMRYGQPGVVHRIGGLRDTVEDGINGFTFSGADLRQQIDAFVRTVRRALTLRREHPEAWRSIRQNAADRRFRWTDTAEAYLRLLYR